MTPKQTAVEWLQVQLNENGKLSAVDFYQAKAMEKEQIIDAHLTGLIYSLEMDATKQAEQYYNETYNTKKP
jgi:hypothetical protein